MNLLAQKIWSNYLFYICYHAGGSTEHLPRPKVKRRSEESSLSDALTPKIGKPDLASKMRTLEVQEARLTANLPQFFTGNISLILQCNNNTITYKYSA